MRRGVRSGRVATRFDARRSCADRARGDGRRTPERIPPPLRPQGDTRLTGLRQHAVLRIVTDTCVRLWRRVHMDLVRYAGCVCRPSC
ncbi:putative leader peptide [Streptomyces cyanogenus]|uniref:putative leader peptide n=1 Tax=Streptomyces cyanogenus TaxID=80860 RepID=UPI003C7BDCEF